MNARIWLLAALVAAGLLLAAVPPDFWRGFAAGVQAAVSPQE